VTSRSQKIVRGTLDLVEATNTCSTADAQQAFFPARGARSLRSMCCKRYARQIIELEQEQENSRSEERFNVASEAHELLDETFGSGSNEYLRATTREYGIALFEGMVMQSQIPRDHVIALLRRMTGLQRSRAGHSSSAEVESILRILLQASPPDKQCCGRNNIYAHTLNSIAQISSQLDSETRSAFEFRRFEDLISDSIPICWLGTRRLSALWVNSFRVFLEGDSTAENGNTAIRDVAQFLSTVISLDCGIQPPSQSAIDLLNSTVIPDYHGNTLGCPKCPKVPQDASFLSIPKSQQQHSSTNNKASQKRMFSTLNNSVSTLFAILTSFTIAARQQPESFEHVRSSAIMSLLGCLSMDIIQAIYSLNQQADGSTYERITAILVATLLSCLHSTQAPAISINDLVHAMETIDQKSRLKKGQTESPLSSIPEFVFATAQSIAKILRIDSWEILEGLIAAMTAVPVESQYTASTRAFLADLALESVEMFAERTESEQAADLAASLRTQNHRTRYTDGVATPFKATSRLERNRDGFMWEGGLCEWVEAGSLSGSNGREIRETVPMRMSRRWKTKGASQSRSVQAQGTACFGSDELDHDELNRGELDHHDDVDSEAETELCISSPADCDSHDSGISMLLLSPMASSSPVVTRAPQSKVANASRPSVSPAKPITASAKYEPLHQVEVQQKVARKRSFRDTDAIETDSEDELCFLPPGTRPAKRQRDYNARGIPTEDADENEAPDELELSFPYSETSRAGAVSKETARRRPRGNVLRSLSNRHVLARRSRSGEWRESNCLDPEDELI
jgi:hypothetical protein